MLGAKGYLEEGIIKKKPQREGAYKVSKLTRTLTF
jgi:hypothetical protein